MRLASSSSSSLSSLKKRFFTTISSNRFFYKKSPVPLVATSSSTSSSSSSANSIRSYYAQPTLPHFEKITVKVPSMGDSITGGTVVEWTAKVGQPVQVDDVIALIETDKVTIDIKAQLNGVIVKQFVEVEEDVEVGKELYMIDTKAKVEEAVKKEEKEDAFKEEQEKVAMAMDDSTTGVQVVVVEEDGGVRIPSIHFLGKKGWWEKRTMGKTEQQQVHHATTTTTPLKPNAVTTIQSQEPLPSNYGRLPLTEREMEDLGLGGAAEAPYNNNNTFQY